MSSTVGICNRALQKLGADRIVDLSENSASARECNAAYEMLRDAELRAHPWSFAIKRTTLAQDADPPEFGYAYQYTLPVDFLRLLSHEYQTYGTDYKIEGGRILSDVPAPFYLRYIYRITDTSKYDPMFAEALATRIAFELCEKITQSNSKGAQLRRDYDFVIREARRANAMEKVSIEFPDTSWSLARL